MCKCDCHFGISLLLQKILLLLKSALYKLSDQGLTWVGGQERAFQFQKLPSEVLPIVTDKPNQREEILLLCILPSIQNRL